jgi:hypothetical protein
MWRDGSLKVQGPVASQALTQGSPDISACKLCLQLCSGVNGANRYLLLQIRWASKLQERRETTAHVHTLQRQTNVSILYEATLPLPCFLNLCPEFKQATSRSEPRACELMSVVVYSCTCSPQHTNTVGPVNIQTSPSYFQGKQIHQTWARMPKNNLKCTNI